MQLASSTLVPNVLTIAGSDPCGGAGIQTDLATFSALRCHGMSVITALTAQNTQGIAAIHVVPPEFVARQIDVIFADIEVAAVKIGMLATAETVEAVSKRLATHRPAFVVLDPVLAATTGASLSGSGVAEALVRHLFPLATLVTPNLAEAAVLTGKEVEADHAAMREAARALQARGAQAVLVKGGHGAGPTSDDLLLDGDACRIFSAPRIATRNTHGTGCTLASAIAANLALGQNLTDAIAAAKCYLSAALETSSVLQVGHGAGPVNHFYDLWESKGSASNPDQD